MPPHEPKGKAVAITFDGPVQSLYSTLAVRLGHSGLFTTDRAEMWRNAAVFIGKAGGKCGLFLHEFAEARDRLSLRFFSDHCVPTETSKTLRRHGYTVTLLIFSVASSAALQGQRQPAPHSVGVVLTSARL